MTRYETKLISKKELRENIVELKFSIDPEFKFNPGQFVNIEVTKPYRKPYSIAIGENGELTFLVEYIEGGVASEYFRNAEVGIETAILGPLGRFQYMKTPLKKVFIFTGTGVAPFISMIKEIKTTMPEVSVDIFSGARTVSNDFPYEYLKEFIGGNIKYTRCISREEESEDEFFTKGRVTSVVPACDYDWENTEFYLCGGGDMIKDMQAILKEKGSNRVYVERYY